MRYSLQVFLYTLYAIKSHTCLKYTIFKDHRHTFTGQLEIIFSIYAHVLKMAQ